MAKKQTVTNLEIKKDLISALKKPPKESKAFDRRMTVVAIIVACFLVVMEFIYPIFIVWFLLFGFVFAIAEFVFMHARLKYRIKNLTLTDYYVTTEVVESTCEEHYRACRGGGKWGRSEQVSNYCISFENGKTWRVPKELYSWHERLRKQDRGIYNTTHRGDAMIVVSKKQTGEIAVAYHADFFEYKPDGSR